MLPAGFGLVALFGSLAGSAAGENHALIHFQLTLKDTSKATFTKIQQEGLADGFMEALEDPASSLGTDVASSLHGRDFAVYSMAEIGNDLNVVLGLDAHSVFADNVIEAVIKRPSFAERVVLQLAKHGINEKAKDLKIQIGIVVPTTGPTRAPTKSVNVHHPYFELRTGACEAPVTTMHECQEAGNHLVTTRHGPEPLSVPPPSESHCWYSPLVTCSYPPTPSSLHLCS
jgi:hypothetical protein